MDTKTGSLRFYTFFSIHYYYNIRTCFPIIASNDPTLANNERLYVCGKFSNVLGLVPDFMYSLNLFKISFLRQLITHSIKGNIRVIRKGGSVM